MKKKNFIPSITSNAESWKTSVSHFSVSKFFFNLKNEKRETNKQYKQNCLCVCVCFSLSTTKRRGKTKRWWGGGNAKINKKGQF